MSSSPIPAFLVSDDPDHLPLALGMISAYCRKFVNREADQKFRFLPTVGLSHAELVQIGQAFGPALWLFSNYVWTTKRCLSISQKMKELDSRNVTIHGGPNAPRYDESAAIFLKQHRHVDFIVRGEGEQTAGELVRHIGSNWHDGSIWNDDLNSIKGITFINPTIGSGIVVKTPDRPRLLDLESLPSPYLDGVFDKGFIRPGNGGNEHNIAGATIETNRGCPYKCTFCDWGSLTNQKIAHFSMERVAAEVEWVARNEIPVLILADANFGIFERDIEIARIVAEIKRRFGYPREFQVSYAKNDSRRRSEIVRILLDAGLAGQGIVSIQTRHPETLEAIKRSNIKNENYDRLESEFSAKHMPLAIELMIGLPGSTVESFKQDLQFYFDRNVVVRANPTRLLMNSPMAEPAYRLKHAIVVEKDTDLVVSTNTFSREDYDEMVAIYSCYRLFVRYSVLTYVMKYLQWDLGISAIDFLQQTARDAFNHLPTIAHAIKVINDTKYPKKLVNQMFYNSSEIYTEIESYIRTRFSIGLNDTAFETVMKVNKSIIPSAEITYPLVVELKHDCTSYFRDRDQESGQDRPRLVDYPAAKFEVVDDFGICSVIKSGSYHRFNPYQTYFELGSNLRRYDGKPNWVHLKRPNY